jgi:hypothetical protein
MSIEIETLRSRKEELRCELETETQKEKSLEESIQILEEKLAIRDLEEKLSARQESVRKLESKKTDLENQFSQPKTQLPAQEEIVKNENPDEQSMGVLVQEEQVPIAESVESAEHSEKKKKHGFF